MSCPTWFTCVVATTLALPTAAGGGEPFQHDDWTAVLQEFVDDRGLVDYQGLASNRAVFDRYITAIQSYSPKSHPQIFPSRPERLAYYINAYNAQVFQGVLSRGPEKNSVWKGLVSGLNFFVRMKIKIGGETMSLKSLEDKLIRAQFQDPRIHAALNCASISCPRLPRRAFLVERLDEQLDSAMREFVADPRHCSIDSSRKVVYLSKIFAFFPEDFLDYEKAQGAAKPRIPDYVNRYRESDAQIPGDYKVKYFAYDKSVNKQ